MVYEYLYVGMFMFCNCGASRYRGFEEYGFGYIAILQLSGIRVPCLGLWDFFLDLECGCRPASRKRDIPALRGHFLGSLGLRFLPGYSCHPGLLRSGVFGCSLRIIRGDRIAPVLMLISPS